MFWYQSPFGRQTLLATARDLRLSLARSVYPMIEAGGQGKVAVVPGSVRDQQSILSKVGRHLRISVPLLSSTLVLPTPRYFSDRSSSVTLFPDRPIPMVSDITSPNVDIPSVGVLGDGNNDCLINAEGTVSRPDPDRSTCHFRSSLRKIPRTLKTLKGSSRHADFPF